ncbi:unnamed protein product [Periconia digitata]|uniref:Uncharacterized protein n=1 Tax=Periconia digitata TaxID=1303443 RepID=A0A9W4XNY6_9PLEO|nr:unnamed protein product [Periconia digitata]
MSSPGKYRSDFVSHKPMSYPQMKVLLVAEMRGHGSSIKPHIEYLRCLSRSHSFTEQTTLGASIGVGLSACATIQINLFRVPCSMRDAFVQLSRTRQSSISRFQSRSKLLDMHERRQRDNGKNIGSTGRPHGRETEPWVEIPMLGAQRSCRPVRFCRPSGLTNIQCMSCGKRLRSGHW